MEDCGSVAVGVTVVLLTLFATVAVYCVTAAENDGLILATLSTKLLKEATLDNRVTVIVYNLIVVPSCAVTCTSIVLFPRFKGKEAELAPLATTAKLPLLTRTRMVAVVDAAVGLTVTELTALPTVVEYAVVPAENVGLRLPALIVKSLKSALIEIRLIVIV